MDIVKLAFMVPLLASMGMNASHACTRVLHADPNQAVMVGRNMDWREDMQTNLIVYPRGFAHNGAADSNPLHWTAQYGSIVATAYDHISTDGLNEAGLAAHILWLNDSDYGTRDSERPALSIAQWLQYYLDNFQSVEEAVAFSRNTPFQVTPLFHPTAKRWISVHLILDDASGDSAILEYKAGKLTIYHDKRYITATNDPTYDKQLQNLGNYSVFGGEKPLPGTSDPMDRFVRASYYAETLPKSASLSDELSGMLSILNNAAQPYTVPSEVNPYESATLWRVVSDITNRIYYFQSTSNQHLLSIRLDQFNLAQGAPAMMLDLVHHPEYVDDVSEKFEVLGKPAG